MTRPLAAAEFEGAAIDTCWKRIGIQGDKSCPELVRHVHCHHCPAFSFAAATLLDREMDEYGQADFAAPPPAPTGEGPSEFVTIFRMGAEWFALPVGILDEIVEARSIHSLPHRRNPAVLGLTNVRGELVICMSIASLLTGVPGSTGGRLVIVHHPSGRLACPVDEVQHTYRYSEDDLRPVPATVGRSMSNLARGLFSWQGRLVARLDEQALFDALGRSLT